MNLFPHNNIPWFRPAHNLRNCNNYSEETEAGPHLALLLDPTIPDTALQAALERDGITARAISSFTDAPAGTNGLLLGFGTFTEREILSGAARIAERAKALFAAANPR